MIYAVIVPAAALLLTLAVLAARRWKKAPPAIPIEEAPPVPSERPLDNPDFIQAAIILSAAGVTPERATTLRCSLCTSPVTVVDEEDIHHLLRAGTPAYCERCLVGVHEYRNRLEDDDFQARRAGEGSSASSPGQTVD